MSLMLGLVLGIGAMMVWWSFWPRPHGSARPSGPGRVQLLLLQAGMEKVTQGGFVWASTVCGVVVALLVFLFTAGPVIALLFGAFGAAVPWAAVKWRAGQRSRALRGQWPDVVDHLRSAIRAGLSLPEALGQLGTKGPEQLRPAFTDFALDYRATARFDESVERLRQRLADPVADKVIAALRITREVGGSDLGEMLATLGSFLRDSARTRGELEARQSWTVNAARLAVAAPWVILLLLASQPQAVRAYSSVTGALVLLAGLGISVLCYRIMLRIGSLPQEERIIK
ncbi:type II secretion system F family protein [Zafaria sp. Z1313]|uniref:type II secretion system F family protein n=1 Tax=unclassified Zafaria TaxID=2828765 RepID=UPI002E77E29A|nr:type II secretion system F family protein [Zafaria sp. J156]MEE1622168.1 type II secretion system F family protein [Zafaria sp. J156]